VRKICVLTCVLVSAVMLAGLVAIPAVAAQDDDPGHQMKWLAVARPQGNLASGGRNPRTRVEIVVERWSTEEERLKYVGLLAEQGYQEVVAAFHKAEPVGRVRVGSGASYPLSFASMREEDGKHLVTLATDRPIGGFEGMHQNVTMRFAFVIVQLTLGDDNKGDGAFTPAAEIKADTSTMTVTFEGYDTKPYRLFDIRPEK